MEIERIRMDKKMILGIPYRGENRAEAISSLWDQFFERLDEIEEFEPGTDFYALSEPVKDGKLKYLVGIEVETVKKLPEGMEIWYVRHENYAVYPHKGEREDVPESFERIYSTLLPQKGLQPSEDYDLEVYTPHYYEREENEGIIYLCAPILTDEQTRLSTDYTELREELIPHGMEASAESSEWEEEAEKTKKDFTFFEDEDLFPQSTSSVKKEDASEEVVSESDE